jgi:putative SOS response-associated peptidase YedK
MTAHMCGRFWTLMDYFTIRDKFGAVPVNESMHANYNTAPTQIAAVVLDENPGVLVGVQWGLVPSWSKEPKMTYSMINAKAETLHEKPAYRTLVKRHRCVVIADGFFEWKTTGKTKQPYAIKYKEGTFAMAGLWDEWKGEDGNTLRTFTIITTSANKLMKSIHDRMPVILRPEDVAGWLHDADEDLLKPFPADEMEAYPISTLVNSPKNNRSEVLKPLAVLK